MLWLVFGLTVAVLWALRRALELLIQVAFAYAIWLNSLGGQLAQAAEDQVPAAHSQWKPLVGVAVRGLTVLGGLWLRGHEFCRVAAQAAACQAVFVRALSTSVYRRTAWRLASALQAPAASPCKGRDLQRAGVSVLRNKFVARPAEQAVASVVTVQPPGVYRSKSNPLVLLVYSNRCQAEGPDARGFRRTGKGGSDGNTESGVISPDNHSRRAALIARVRWTVPRVPGRDARACLAQ